MRKFLNIDTVFGSILLSNFVSGGVVTMERTADAVATSTDLEDRFVEYFKGNPVFYNGGWTKKMLELSFKGSQHLESRLAEFCAGANKAAGFGNSKVDFVSVNPSVLKFDHEQYPAKKILVVTYGTEDSWHRQEHHGHHYRYVTKGTREDCVFYLNLVEAGEYKLEREVCGIESKL